MSREQANSLHLTVPPSGNHDRPPTPTSPNSPASSILGGSDYTRKHSSNESCSDDGTNSEPEETKQEGSCSSAALRTSGLDLGSDTADMAGQYSDVPRSLVGFIQKLNTLKDASETSCPELAEAIQEYVDGLTSLSCEATPTFTRQFQAMKLQMGFQDKVYEIQASKSEKYGMKDDVLHGVPKTLEAFQLWVNPVNDTTTPTD